MPAQASGPPEAAPDESRAGRGRPRSGELDRKIIECAMQELMSRGYGGMSIDAVAQRAGVSKATVYRRYADKADLVTAAIAAQPAPDVSAADGSTRERLVNLTELARKRMIDGGGMRVLSQILAESERNPQLLEQHRERTVALRRAEFEDVLRSGIERGDVRPDADIGTAVSVISGAWMAGYVAGQPFAAGWAESVVSLVWPGIASAHGG
jgi:AcrR family transcriptional regulator